MRLSPSSLARGDPHVGIRRMMTMRCPLPLLAPRHLLARGAFRDRAQQHKAKVVVSSVESLSIDEDGEWG